jgi:GrpB-like predicted nucleotidyltransferase (UPF0157 family)
MKFLPPGIYQPKAWLAYHQIREQILTVLPSARIEHIGSSSVEGIVSKGDLDIFVGVDASSFVHAISVLQALRFTIKENTLRTHLLSLFFEFIYGQRRDQPLRTFSVPIVKSSCCTAVCNSVHVLSRICPVSLV